MWDAWADGDASLYAEMGLDTGSIARFNHVPGGSNVLYMDGHVEWVRYQSKWPIASPELDPDLNNLDSMMGEVISIFGGNG
jgi:prepilin-type processing-associated H-X9-DG protein